MTKYNLSEAEFEIMEYIWTNKQAVSFNEVMEYTTDNGHTWKKQTVQTFLTRLIDKGALKADKKGNKRYYSPSMNKEEYISQWTRGLLNIEFGGSLKGFLSAFTGGKSLTKEEAQELHDFLDEYHDI